MPIALWETLAWVYILAFMLGGLLLVAMRKPIQQKNNRTVRPVREIRVRLLLENQ